jgi:isopenicillin-N N-acyltransferase-like protein
LDLSPVYQDFGVMLHITPDRGPAILCYSQIGSVAHAGINSAGIGLVINALYSSGWGPGVPRPILYRLILEKENIDDAAQVVIGAKRASSCNYLFSQPSGKMANLEVTPGHFGLTEFAGEIVVHTNHYAHPDMVKFEKRPKEKLQNSQFRDDRFKQLLSNQPKKLSLANLKTALTDHQIFPQSVCAHAEGNPWNIATIASIIAEPAKGQMHVSLGQGCANHYATYSI